MKKGTNRLCMTCADCCRPTEEIFLSRADLDAIVGLGHGVEEFSRVHEETGLRVLKNKDGQCVFLEGDGPFRCKIYPDHPRGCKIYPLIYDADERRCLLDKKYCRHWKAFEQELKDPGNCEALVRFLRDVLKVIK